MNDLSSISEAVLQAAYDALPEMAGERALDRVVVAVVKTLATHKAKAWGLGDGPIDHWFPSIWARQELEAIATEINDWSLGES